MNTFGGDRASRDLALLENRPLQKRIESEKLEIMYIVDDPFTALAFVYLYDYGTDVCGGPAARSYIESCYASYAGIIHSAAIMFSLEQLAGHVIMFQFHSRRIYERV